MTLNLIVTGVKLWTVMGHSSGERKLRVLYYSSWTVLNVTTLDAPMHCLAERQNCYNNTIIACNILLR